MHVPSMRDWSSRQTHEALAKDCVRSIVLGQALQLVDLEILRLLQLVCAAHSVLSAVLSACAR